MNSKILKTLIGAVILGLGVATTSAQTPPASVPPATMPAIQGPLGDQLRALMATHRAANTALFEQRKTALAAMVNAAPADREALKAALRAIMREHQQNQRELAKSIRDAIKARRDQPSGG